MKELRNKKQESEEKENQVINALWILMMLASMILAFILMIMFLS